MVLPQPRFNDELSDAARPPFRSASTRPRRKSFAEPRSATDGRHSWEALMNTKVEVSAGTPAHGSSHRKAYYGHNRGPSGSSGEYAYAARPPPPPRRPKTPETTLQYSGDGIRVYAEANPNTPPPPRDSYTPVHTPRHAPPPEDPYGPHSSIPRIAPIRIPTMESETPSAPTHFSGFSSHVPYHYGESPRRPPFHNPPAHSYDNLNIPREPRSSRPSDPTPMPRSHRRGSSYREEDFRFPHDSHPPREPQYWETEGRWPRRPSTSHLDASSVSATWSRHSPNHSHTSSAEAIFPFQDDDSRPKRRNSVREQTNPYAGQPKGNVRLHQTAFEQAAATGVLRERTEDGNGGRRKSYGGDAPVKELWIAVMGVTGSGKSTFIRMATGDQSVGINHGLKSCTREVEVHSCRIGDYTVNLIDTPGFDDSKRSETEVLQTISTYLAKAYYNKIYLNGIIYMHPIQNTRMKGSDIRNIGILERLVGEENMDNVLLVTNMWDGLDTTSVVVDGRLLSGHDVGRGREQELCTTGEYWGNLINNGAQIARHRGDSLQSAHQLIYHFMSSETKGGIGRAMKLRLQHELVDRRLRLEETDVGQFINEELYKVQKLLEQDIEIIKKKHNRVMEGKGSNMSANELEGQLDEKKQGLRNVRKKAEILGRKVDELVDEHGNKVGHLPVGRTSGPHAGLCRVM